VYARPSRCVFASCDATDHLQAQHPASASHITAQQFFGDAKTHIFPMFSRASCSVERTRIHNAIELRTGIASPQTQTLCHIQRLRIFFCTGSLARVDSTDSIAQTARIARSRFAGAHRLNGLQTSRRAN